MLLRRLYDDKLAQASYIIGCQATGDAIVVDPLRDVESYVAAAEAEGVRITHVTETHIHADFASGARELALRTGARLLLSDEGDANWKYAFAQSAGAQLLHDGDSFMVGNIRLTVWHTPGHTPEHICFLVTDTPATAEPMGAVTGDFVFVGDVGRPDLLERAANVAGTMRISAQHLFHSIQRFKTLPDYLQIWPGHGAGSACGKALGAIPSSTLGYERIANWAFQIDTEEEFVDEVLRGQPEPPRYFALMKQINKIGPDLLNGFRMPPVMHAAAVAEALQGTVTVVDLRPAPTFATRFIAGSINIPMNKSFTNWAGSLLNYDRDVVLIGDEGPVRSAVRDLALIGFDRVTGWSDPRIVDSWQGETGSIAQMTVNELSSSKRQVIDVRRATEWQEGHVQGAHHMALNSLPARLSEIRRDQPVAIMCKGGGRSSIAASLLHAQGYRDLVNVTGGIDAWSAADLPVIVDEPAAD